MAAHLTQELVRVATLLVSASAFAGVAWLWIRCRQGATVRPKHGHGEPDTPTPPLR